VSVGGKASTPAGALISAGLLSPIFRIIAKWDEAVQAVIQIVDAWKKGAEPDERMREWIDMDRLGQVLQKSRDQGEPEGHRRYIYGNEFARSDLRFGW